MIIRLILAATFVLSTASFAKENPWDSKSDFLTEKQFKKQMKWMENQRKKNKKNSRKMANADRVDYASVFSDDAKNLSSEFIGGNVWKDGKPTGKKMTGVKTSEDLAKLIEKYDDDKIFNSLSDQGKWLAAQITSIKAMRGIVTRVRPLISKSKAAFVHSFIVTWIRSINAGISAFNPSSEWEVGFDYLVKPYAGMPAKITTEEQLYLFVKGDVLKGLNKFNARIRSLAYNGDELKDNFKPFYFDNKLLYSTMKTVDEQDRFVVIDRGEVHSTLSNINLAISSTKYGLAYQWKGLLNTINRIALTYGFNNILTPSPGKMTAQRRVKAIKKNKKLFTLLPERKNMPQGGVVWTKAAYPFFKEGVRQGRLAWTYVREYQGYRNEQRPLLDPRAFVPFQRVIDTSFDSIADLIEGKGVRSAMIRGENIKVDLQKMFNEPPANLKEFLAVKFVKGKKELVEPKSKMKYRNYKLGNPAQWNLEMYEPYFPGIDQDGVPNAARILSQTWGGNILGAAFFPVLF